MKLFELRRQLADKQNEGRAIVDKAIAEARNCTPEEDAKIAEIRTAITDLQNKIKLFEARDSFEATADPEERSAVGLGPELPDLDGYSLLRALQMNLDSREGKGQYNGLEGEVHAELNRSRRAQGMNPAQGILIPWSLSNRQFTRDRVERRDVTTSTAAGGIANILGTELIELLRNKMVMRLLGARVLSGLSGGTFSLPKQTAAATASHTAEGIAAASSNLTLGQVTWTPRTLTAITAVTRKTLLQSSIDVEAVVREDLMKVLAIEYDRVGINGSGQNNVPLGIMQDPNVPEVAIGTNGGAMTWATILALESQVAQANADFGDLAYLTSNKGRAQLKQIAKIGSTFPVFLWEKGMAYGEGEVNSYRAVATQQVPSNLTKGSGTSLTALIYGNFASATYGLWSGMDMLVDPYTAGNAGTVKIYMYQDYDFQMRWESSFAVCPDMATS